MNASYYTENIPLNYLNFALDTQSKLFEIIYSDKSQEDKYDEFEAYRTIRVNEVNNLCIDINNQLQQDKEIQEEYLPKLHYLNSSIHVGTRTTVITCCNTASGTLANNK